MEAVFVDIVSKVVTPSATRAGTAFGSIQNENLQRGPYQLIFELTMK